MVRNLAEILIYLEKHKRGFRIDNIESIVRKNVLTNNSGMYDKIYIIRMLFNQMTIVMDHGESMDIISVSHTHDPKYCIRKLLIDYHLSCSMVAEMFDMTEADVKACLSI